MSNLFLVPECVHGKFKTIISAIKSLLTWYVSRESTCYFCNVLSIFFPNAKCCSTEPFRLFVLSGQEITWGKHSTENRVIRRTAHKSFWERERWEVRICDAEQHRGAGPSEGRSRFIDKRCRGMFLPSFPLFQHFPYFSLEEKRNCLLCTLFFTILLWTR